MRRILIIFLIALMMTSHATMSSAMPHTGDFGRPGSTGAIFEHDDEVLAAIVSATSDEKAEIGKILRLPGHHVHADAVPPGCPAIVGPIDIAVRFFAIINRMRRLSIAERLTEPPSV